jgi:hypothetical protein
MSTTDHNEAGHSAEREYTSRRHARQARIKARYGTAGSIVAALAGEPRHVHGWREGAEGEAATARALHVRLSRSDVIVLHDRRAGPRSRANIDHIAIAPTGVMVIDSKAAAAAFSSQAPESSTAESSYSSAAGTRTSQLDSLQRQIERVVGVLDRNGAAHAPVSGALSFPFMRREWPHASRARDGLIIVDDPAHIAKQLKRPGPIGADEIAWLADTLAAAFPSA